MATRARLEARPLQRQRATVREHEGEALGPANGAGSFVDLRGRGGVAPQALASLTITRSVLE